MPTAIKRISYSSTVRWYRADERRPERNWTFIVCTRMGDVYPAHYDGDGIWRHTTGLRLVIEDVELWAKLPVAPWRRSAS